MRLVRNSCASSGIIIIARSAQLGLVSPLLGAAPSEAKFQISACFIRLYQYTTTRMLDVSSSTKRLVTDPPGRVSLFCRELPSHYKLYWF